MSYDVSYARVGDSMSVDVREGNAPGQVVVTFTTTALPPGVYFNSVVIRCNEALNSPQRIPVTITVLEGTAPRIAATPLYSAFDVMAGSTTPQTVDVAITNDGGGTLVWTATPDSPWLSANVYTGTAPSTLTLTADPTGLEPGNYVGQVTLSGVGAAAERPVIIELTVRAGPPLIAVSPESLTLTGWSAQVYSSRQRVQLSNPNSGSMAFTVSSDAS